MSLDSLIGKLANHKELMVPAAMATVLSLPPNFLTLPIVFAANKFKQGPAKTAVFTTASFSFLPNRIVTWITDLVMYAPIVVRQVLNGNKVDWYSNPTRQEVLEQLVNEQYENIVLVGHGSRESYNARDGMVTSWDIIGYGIAKKPGELRQHTCGRGEGCSLRETLLKDTSKGYSYGRLVSIWESYFRACIEAFRKGPSKTIF